MCIFCTGRKWWRGGAAAMLPWLVFPLVVMWALSGLLLPPRLRIHPTLPRLACVLILLSTLFWYEILLPRLSLWRARHSALLRDRRLSHAIHLHNLRRSATRRCRNCLSPYPLHAPSPARRFMCPNCGHLSKRPILDLPSSPPSAFSPDPLLLSACNLLLCISSFLRWARRTLLVVMGYPRETYSSSSSSSGNDSKDFSSDKGESFSESRIEKARRKAEEKRQARLEKEMLEEEERKQREEVARLVEERRKLRDEMLEAEKESLRRSASAGKRENRKGAGRRRQEGRKEKDKGSSKSNSDCEEIEKRASRERDGKHAFDGKYENQKKASQRMIASRVVPLHSPPRGFKAAASVVKANNKPANRYDRGQVSMNRKDAQSAVHATRKITLNGNDRKVADKFRRPLESDVQPELAIPKRSWLQLFTRSSAVSPCSDDSSTNLLYNSSPVQTQNVQITDEMLSPSYPSDNHVNLGQPPSLTGYPPINYPIGSNPVSRLAAEHMPPFFKGSRRGLIPDDTDIFEDPCFVPDPVSLLAPVSESLDNLPLDLGPGFVANNYIEEPRLMKKVPASTDVSRPSPIESPLSRLRVSGERDSIPGKLSRGMRSSNLEDTSSAHEPGTWQMWGSPMAQNGLGLVGGANWFSHIGQNNSSKEETTQALLHDPLLSHVAKENNFPPSRQMSPSTGIGNYQNGGICSPLGQLPDGSDLWVQRSLFSTLPADGDNYSFPLSQMDKLLLNEVGCDTPNGSASSENSESSPANCWPK